MFTSIAANDTARPSVAVASPPTRPFTTPITGLSEPTVVAGALIGSALVGRLMAWMAGGATVTQLVALLGIAALALLAGHRAYATAEPGGLDARLAGLTLRAGVVQTGLGLFTLGLAIH